MNFNTINSFLVRLVVSPALIGIVFLVLRSIFSRFPAKNINMIYGYRTKKSMLSQETWVEANTYSGTLIGQLGKVTILLGVLCSIFFHNLIIISFTTVFVTIVIAVLLVVLTERRLNALFDDYGKKRN